jgi:hypothetical protein
MNLTPFERALVAHLVADWILQNDWMARNKTDLRHPAGWVHAGIHGLCMAWALGPLAGVVLGVVHLLIDTRYPLHWWIRVYKRCTHSPEATHIAIWTDQVLHILSFALWVQFLG